MAKQDWKRFLIPGAIVFVILAYVFPHFSLGSLFLFSILPVGQYNSNDECTFITNVNPPGAWTVQDYFGTSAMWIALDTNNDGTNEAYSQLRLDTSPPTPDYCSTFGMHYMNIKALENLSIIYDSSSNYVYICQGSSAAVYKSGAADAITSCGIPGTARVNVHVNVTICQSYDINCDGIIDRTELGTSVIAYLNNTITRTELSEVITEWAS